MTVSAIQQVEVIMSELDMAMRIMELAGTEYVLTDDGTIVADWPSGELETLVSRYADTDWWDNYLTCDECHEMIYIGGYGEPSYVIVGDCVIWCRNCATSPQLLPDLVDECQDDELACIPWNVGAELVGMGWQDTGETYRNELGSGDSPADVMTGALRYADHAVFVMSHSDPFRVAWRVFTISDADHIDTVG